MLPVPVVREPDLVRSLDDQHAVFIASVSCLNELSFLDAFDLIQDGDIEPDVIFDYLVVSQIGHPLLLERSVANEPAQLNVLPLFVECQEPDLSLSVGEVVADEANELHVVQVDNLLWLLLVSQVDHDQLSVIWRESFINQQRVVNLH